MPVTEIEAAVVRHYTSRAGDPHRHLHVQINARVLAEETWRGLHSVGMRDSLAAINGIGHAAVATDPEFRAVLTAHGFTLDPATGELAELAPYVGKFSARTAQIGRNLDRYEAEWRHANPGAEPGPGLRQAWDRRAWAQARPDKVVPTDGAALVGTVERGAARPRLPRPAAGRATDRGRRTPGRGASTATRWSRSSCPGWGHGGRRGTPPTSAARSSSGSPAPVSWPSAAVRIDLAEDLTARALSACEPLLPRTDVPEHIRALHLTRGAGRRGRPRHPAHRPRRAARPRRRVRRP